MLLRTVAAVISLFLFLICPVSLAQSSATQADLNRVRAEIASLKRNIEIKEAELRVLESQMARQSANPASAPKPAPSPAKAPESTTVTVSAPVPAAIPASARRRSNVDPAPYEAAITSRVSQFRTNQSSEWLILDEKRIVFWVLDDEAYLLNLTQYCEGLLSAKNLSLENFSTRVRAGKDGVVFDNQRCLIESIAKLGGRSLPKPPKK